MADAVEELISKRRLQFRFMKHDGWENALFVHWPVDPTVLAALLPRGLEPDILDETAWVGLVLLTERGVSAHHWLGRQLVPPVDHFGANVRTYVRRAGVPGIFFFSLECSSWLATLGARLGGIPYCPAWMQRSVDIERPLGAPKRLPGSSSCGGCLCFAAHTSSTGVKETEKEEEGFTFQFSSTRLGFGPFGRRPEVSASWQLRRNAAARGEPTDGKQEEEELFRARATWFIERYSVYAAFPWGSGPILLRGDVQHPPWHLLRAELVSLSAEPLLAAAGLPGLTKGPEAQEPHVCFSRGVAPVEFWMLEPV